MITVVTGILRRGFTSKKYRPHLFLDATPPKNDGKGLIMSQWPTFKLWGITYYLVETSKQINKVKAFTLWSEMAE